jgi:TonB family protein
MHRSIHLLWGFGALEDWDEQGSSSPFNNPNLLTTLEIVLNSDGTIDKVTIVKSSGYLAYDTAAIDTAFTAGPYPEPPREIRSANGKIYVHWRFYRDGRQCATSGVDYFILNNPPANGDKPAVAGDGATQRALEAGAPMREGPRRLHRDVGDDEAHRAKMRALDEEIARAENRPGASGGGEEPAAAAPTRAEKAQAATAAVPQANDPEARNVAARFFAGLSTGDVSTMAGLSEVPVRTTGGASVKSKAELQPMLKDLAGELGRHALGGVEVLTAAGVRSEFGKLPQGLDDGTGTLLFAVAPLKDGDALMAALAKRGAFYRIVALVRR